MKQDVIILGGGILGVTLGFFAARAGLRPLVIEPGEIGGGTTSASFAWANASTKVNDAAYHALNAQGVAGHERLAGEFGAQALGIQATGALQVVAESDAAGFAALERDARQLRQFGYATRWLDNAQLRRAEPDLAFAPDEQALLLAPDLVVDAPRFTRYLAGQMAAAGGRILTARATALLMDEAGEVRGVETDTGTLLAPLTVLATGKDTGAVLADLTGHAPFAHQFPLRQVPGLLLTTPPVARAPRHVLYTSTSHELHMLPSADGGIKLGSDDVDALIWEDRSPAAMARAGAALLARGARFCPGLAQNAALADCRLQVGVRPYPEDGLPLVGPLPGAQGLFVLATHSGITLAPVLGALLADWLASGRMPAALAPYALSRFPGFQAS